MRLGKSVLLATVLLSSVMVAIVGCRQRAETLPAPNEQTPGRQAEATSVWWQEGEQASDQRVDRILPGATTAWSFPPAPKQAPYAIERDATIGRNVLVCTGPGSLTITGRTVYEGGVDVSCFVRAAGGAGGGRFSIAACKDPDDDKSIGLPVTITCAADGNASVTAPALASTRFAHSNPEMAGFSPKAGSLGFRYLLRAYSAIQPTWEPQVRATLERDMADLPLAQDKWFLIRYSIGPDWARAWVDGRLVLDHQSDELKTSGVIQINMGPGSRLASVSVQPLAADGALYEPISLDGYVRDREFVGGGVRRDSLSLGQTVRVEGIPFTFADPKLNGGADHIDVGRSILRQANMAGYYPSYGHRLVGTAQVDPGRIQLRVPNGRYDAMYVIAAFDEEQDSIPLLSASFYRPSAGFARIFEATVPSYRAQVADAVPLPVRLADGHPASLWLVKIPLSPEALASFADMEFVELELTKKVYQYRSYPDPFIYGWHQGGLPSGVHVYALTLHRPPVHMTLDPAAFGHVWTSPGKPAYDVTLVNRTAEARSVELTVETTSHDGAEKTTQAKAVSIPAGKSVQERFSFTVEKFGIHGLAVTMKNGEENWTERRNFAHLAPDTRAVKWEEGKGPLFGYWSYHGGHYTAPGREIARLMIAAGARASLTGFSKNPELKDLAEKYALRQGPNAWPVAPQWAWAGEEPLDMEKYEAYKKTAVEALRQAQGDNPDLVAFFPEPHISRDLTAGNLPSYWGEPPYQYNEQEKKALRVFFNTSKAAAEGIRQEWPDTKILIPWGDPLFVVPLLREGFPKDLIDGSGLDMVGFERLPEQQIHQMSTHRLYMLTEEYRRAGIDDPLLPYVEGTFVPTEPGAVTWQEQADLYHRWTLMSLAYGITRFYSGWFAFDCGDYYGAEHYGGCGIQRRIPYNDPKPAYAHYATMTRMLDGATFEKWLPTGSHTTYCLQFGRENKGPVYALWTVRGKRPVMLTWTQDGAATVTDAMDNATALAPENRVVTVMTSGSPVYVTGAGEIASAAVGQPDHSDAVEWARNHNQQTWHSGLVAPPVPAPKAITVASLGDGTWTLRHESDEIYEGNNFDTKRYPGRMSSKIVTDPERPGPVLAVHLDKQEKERQLMPWYTVIRPRRPVTIPGKSFALGLWVQGASDWGRVVYCLRDANDEKWISIGFKDQWNCDDVHSWSSFNFDGWRYVRFELPGHAPYDTFREFGTTWWRYAGGKAEGIGVVDLPLRIEKIIVERRTHVLYVNDIQPTNAEDNDVLLGDLIAEYESQWHTTKAVVAQSRIRLPLPPPPKDMPNPIREMAAEGALPPVQLRGVRDPDWGYDGTRCHVEFDQAEDATEYQVWVAAHEDGGGAVQTGTMKESGGLVQNLAPGVELYLWVTYTTEQGEGEDRKLVRSKPSNRLRILLVDAFGMK